MANENPTKVSGPLTRNAVKRKTDCSQNTEGTMVDVNFTWTISNFTFKTKAMKNKEALQSKLFSADGDERFQWQLRCYPKGNTEVCKDGISYFLYLQSATKIMVGFVLSVLDSTNGTFFEQRKLFHTFTNPGDHSLGFSNFLSQKDVLEMNSKYLKDDSLTLQCQLTYEIENNEDLLYSAKDKTPRIETSQCRIAHHLGHLLDSGRMSDILFTIGRRKFKAHKTIMSARSPVFAGKFEVNGKLSPIESLKIEDCEPEVFQAMLRFIYTDEMEETEEMAKKLLTFAKNYQIELLKFKCEEILMKHISTANCAEMLLLADMNETSALKKDTLDFIRHRSGEVIKTAGWQTLRQTRPQLVVEIFEFMAS